MENRLVPHGHEFPNISPVIVREMHNRAILHIRARADVTMRLMSPRRTVWNHTLDSSASVTSPITSAPGATKADG